jgi:hypothetical protein
MLLLFVLNMWVFVSIVAKYLRKKSLFSTNEEKFIPFISDAWYSQSVKVNCRKIAGSRYMHLVYVVNSKRTQKELSINNSLSIFKYDFPMIFVWGCRLPYVPC